MDFEKSKIKSRVYNKLRDFSTTTAEENTFDEADLKELGERTKHMSILSQATGYLQKLHGIQHGSVYHLQLALETFERALSSNPNNKVILR